MPCSGWLLQDKTPKIVAWLYRKKMARKRNWPGLTKHVMSIRMLFTLAAVLGTCINQKLHILSLCCHHTTNLSLLYHNLALVLAFSYFLAVCSLVYLLLHSIATASYKWQANVVLYYCFANRASSSFFYFTFYIIVILWFLSTRQHGIVLLICIPCEFVQLLMYLVDY